MPALRKETRCLRNSIEKGERGHAVKTEVSFWLASAFAAASKYCSLESLSTFA